MLDQTVWNMLISVISTKVAEKKHGELYRFFMENVRLKLEHSNSPHCHYVTPILEVRSFHGGWEPVYERGETIELHKPKLI